MYVSNRALTFADLAKAVQRSAPGLGQVTCDAFGCYDESDYASSSVSALQNQPLTGGTNIGETPQAQSIANAPLIAAAGTSMPWGTLAAVAAGLILFSAFVGRR